MFTYELSQKDVEVLKDFSLLKKNRNISIWAYYESTLELITDVFSSAHKAGIFFNVSYRTILAHLDTSKPTIQNGKLVLLFSRELSE